MGDRERLGRRLQIADEYAPMLELNIKLSKGFAPLNRACSSASAGVTSMAAERSLELAGCEASPRSGSWSWATYSPRCRRASNDTTQPSLSSTRILAGRRLGGKRRSPVNMNEHLASNAGASSARAAGVMLFLDA